jgi:hypothetical protein
LVKAVEFEALTAVAMKIYINWDIMPCSPLKVDHLQGRRAGQAKISVKQAARGVQKLGSLTLPLAVS